MSSIMKVDMRGNLMRRLVLISEMCRWEQFSSNMGYGRFCKDVTWNL